MSTVVLDAGHGGATAIGGSSPNNATSVSGRLEKDLTLAVARHAQAALVARGHTVLMTRTSDVNLGLLDRARVARDGQAGVFVSVHFNGFGDPAVQGTETWVHLQASADSQALAACVQSAALQATGHRNRGVQAKRLGVLTPSSHAPGTAACLAELSFITTTAEDRRLGDPAYLQALGAAVASGVEAFLTRPMPSAVPVPVAEAAEPFVPSPRAAAPTTVPHATPELAPAVEVDAAVTVSVVTTDAILADVRQAIAALPKKATKAKFDGPVASDGDANSHIQGLASYKDVFLLTHSDRSSQSGRILVVDRRPAQQKLIAEFRLPRLAPGGPSLYHAGGCQVLGDVLAVPSESGQNVSVVAFFDVSDPSNIREVNPALRIVRPTRDAAAAGLVRLTRNGQHVWCVAAYDSGTVDFYESADLPGGAPFVPLFRFKVEEKHHQALLLLTDQTNKVFAVGLNRTFFGRNDLVLYEVDLVAQTMIPAPDRPFSPDGGSLRWGAGLEIVGAQSIHMHCTSRNYGNRCTINAFVPSAMAPTAFGAKSSGAGPRKRAAGKATAKRASARKATKKSVTAKKATSKKAGGATKAAPRARKPTIAKRRRNK